MGPDELRAMADRLEAEAAKLRKIAEQMDNPVQAGIDEVLKQLAELNQQAKKTPAIGRHKRAQAGGNARAAKLTADERREIAKKAAAARWGSKQCGTTISDWPFGDCNGEKS